MRRFLFSFLRGILPSFIQEQYACVRDFVGVTRNGKARQEVADGHMGRLPMAYGACLLARLVGLFTRPSGGMSHQRIHDSTYGLANQ